jgi:hypothetical protein
MMSECIYRKEAQRRGEFIMYTGWKDKKHARKYTSRWRMVKDAENRGGFYDF